MLATRYFFLNEFAPYIDEMKKYEHTPVTFSKGECLKSVNDEFEYNYLILNGLCRLSVLHDSGNERIIGYWGNGSMYPIITTLQRFTLEYSIIVKAMTKTVTLRFDTDNTRAFIRDHPNISYEMIDHYCKFTNLLLYTLTTEAYEPLKTRICSLIMIYCLNFGNVELPLSQSEVSSLIGARRSSVVKIIRELKDDGCIDTSNGHICIRDKDTLNSYCSVFV